MKKLLSLILICIFTLPVFAQDTIVKHSLSKGMKTANMNTVYHRSSWHNILIYHDDQKYAEEILTTYYNRPTSEKFNDHSLPIDVVTTKGKKYTKFKKIDKYIMNNNIANDLVAKWFNRNDSTGYCDMELIYRRGIEGASTENVEMSDYVKRGKAILMDSGTDLIGNTFVLAHDIVYIDKGERNKNVAEGISLFGDILKIAGEVMASSTGDNDFLELGNSVDELSKTTADIVDDFEGFRVKIQTHLYKLNWQDSDNEYFYENYYLDENYYDAAKHQAWQNANYTLTYIGTQEAICGQTVLKDVYDLSQLIKIVLYRTMDESIVKLQKNYEEFRIKEPIYEIDEENGYVIAKIGLKEGVNENSKYEVLERIETEDGTTKYKKVGEIKPVKDKIWDNRYMAFEDGAPNSELNGTTFKITNGKKLYPGLLIREIKF
ncbi:MAG: hypothetical protein J6R17_09600 [Bacteroidales bacterium]|nr:hypothetical protein [Bacteroidales bacterium]MBO5849441.1 hypothetical protein [Bacteroidales bacterium]